ncbi:hypothetical protein [Saccharomonospora piscinae]|uniref:hypothetical protein n=1 Tax=Saccharomonospora piscinae TaxID=687388 RepID=UPI0004647158|nr:hypothetical protein [Saccharomonospora piscinae]
MDPVLEAVATALAAKSAQAVVAGGKGAWKALVRLVRDRFAEDPAAKRAWQEAVADPDDAGNVGSLTRALADTERASPEFGVELRKLWHRASVHPDVGTQTVVNQIDGDVESAVQARDIHGGIAFGHHPGPHRTR